MRSYKIKQIQNNTGNLQASVRKLKATNTYKAYITFLTLYGLNYGTLQDIYMILDVPKDEKELPTNITKIKFEFFDDWIGVKPREWCDDEIGDSRIDYSHFDFTGEGEIRYCFFVNDDFTNRLYRTLENLTTFQKRYAYDHNGDGDGDDNSNDGDDGDGDRDVDGGDIESFTVS